MQPRTSDVIVIGGGLGGLACAALLARGGLSVRLLERSSALGGRAGTDRAHGFCLNRGPHALYRGGPARAVLERLGVEPGGRRPPSAGLALRDGRLYTLPGTPWTLVSTRLLRLPDKLRLARWMSGLSRLHPADLASVDAASWLATQFDDPAARQLAAAIVRLSTYSADLDTLSAEAAVAQLAQALEHGVDYLDGGWQPMVDAVADAARRAGVVIHTDHPVTRVELTEPREVPPRVRVQVKHAASLEAGRVVVAGGPDLVRSVASDFPLESKPEDEPPPVTAACLDLGLSSLPRPRAPSFALGLDNPLYYSVHSATADLAPPGGALIHAAHYGHHDDARPRIEAMLDAIQPGWRDRVVTQRYLPRMVVAHDLPRAQRGGFAGRRDARLSSTGRLWAVGDWVGGEGLLLDAVMASARDVAARIVEAHGKVESRAA